MKISLITNSNEECTKPCEGKLHLCLRDNFLLLEIASTF